MGPLVTLAVARRQINATVLSANRQKWIEAAKLDRIVIVQWKIRLLTNPTEPDHLEL